MGIRAKTKINRLKKHFMYQNNIETMYVLFDYALLINSHFYNVEYVFGLFFNGVAGVEQSYK